MRRASERKAESVSISTTSLVLTAWAFALFTASFAIGVMVSKAWRDNAASGLWWRKAKIVGTVGATVGLIAAMMAFEGTLRQFNEDADKFAFEQLLEFKFDTTLATAIACSGEQRQISEQNDCSDLRNINNKVNVFALRNRTEIPKLVKWQHNARLGPIIVEAGRDLDNFNSAERAASQKPLISMDARIGFSLLAVFLISVSLACSVGEAVFQWRQERARAEAPGR